MSNPRAALYYPFIHLRDPDWLKATLLCFPRVLRMVPPGFDLNDPPQTRPFTTLTGPKGDKLVDAYDLDPPFLRMVQDAFRARLQADLAERGDLLRRGLMLPNAKKLTGRSDAFQIAANLRASSFSTSNQSNLHGRRMILTGREEDG